MWFNELANGFLTSQLGFFICTLIHTSGETTRALDRAVVQSVRRLVSEACFAWSQCYQSANSGDDTPGCRENTFSLRYAEGRTKGKIVVTRAEDIVPYDLSTVNAGKQASQRVSHDNQVMLAGGHYYRSKDGNSFRSKVVARASNRCPVDFD
jgi:hypothetical protein